VNEGQCVGVQAYVSCSLGIWMVGFVVICFGVTDSLSSLLFGYVTKFLGRPAVFAFGKHFVLHIHLH
jgi:hypothetical protein